MIVFLLYLSGFVCAYDAVASSFLRQNFSAVIAPPFVCSSCWFVFRSLTDIVFSACALAWAFGADVFWPSTAQKLVVLNQRLRDLADGGFVFCFCVSICVSVSCSFFVLCVATLGQILLVSYMVQRVNTVTGDSLLALLFVCAVL